MALKLTLYSDYVWPFCFIAEQSSLVRLQEQYDIELEWHGFELHPETPPGGVPVSTFFPAAELDQVQRHLVGFAERFGIEGMRVSGHVPNTRRALAVTELARERGVADRFREAAMSAFWREGRDIESDETLAALATAAGLEPTEALAAADSPDQLARVDALREQAHARGVHAIPAFFFGEGTPPVVGCQPYERLAAAAERAGAVRRA